MTPRPVVVEWHDSAHISPGDWVDRAHLGDVTPCAVVTAGWLVARSEAVIVIAQSLSEAGDATGVFVIPRCNVVAIRKLKRPK